MASTLFPVLISTQLCFEVYSIQLRLATHARRRCRVDARVDDPATDVDDGDREDLRDISVETIVLGAPEEKPIIALLPKVSKSSRAPILKLSDFHIRW